MNEVKNYNAMLKRFLKRKIKITEALVVAFLITGSVGFALDTPVANAFESAKLAISADVNLVPGNTAVDVDILGSNRYLGLNIDSALEISLGGLLGLGSDLPNFNLGSFDINDPLWGSTTLPTLQGLLSPTLTNTTTIQNTGNFGMFVTGGYEYSDLSGVKIGVIGAQAVNEVGGVIANIGNYGIAADLNATAINRGTVSNVGDYGMFASHGGMVINEEGGIVANTGNYGMVDAGGQPGFVASSSAINNGIVSNGGEFGMLATVTKKEDEDAKFGMVVNNGLVSNGSNFGMVGLNGGIALNKENGIVENNGNYGMLAQGYIERDELGNIDISLPGIAYNLGVVKNNGNNGMYATDYGIIVNVGTVANVGDYGMVAESEVNAEVVNEVGGIIANKGNYGLVVKGTEATGYNLGVVGNEGDYGILALNGGIAQNHEQFIENELVTGTVANKGDYGIVADGVGSEVLNHGLVANEGNYGMVAINGGLAQNLVITLTNPDTDLPQNSTSLIANKGNYGMVAIGVDSKLVNEGAIANGGDYGLYISDAYGTNKGVVSNEGNVGVLLAGNATFRNEGVISPGNNGSEEGKIALLAGAGNNTLYLKGEMEGIVDGGAGINTLIFYGNRPDDDKDGRISSYGDFKDGTFTHLGVQNGELVVDKNLVLGLGTPAKNLDFNPNANGVITFDKFNGFEFTKNEGGVQTWVSDIYENDGTFQGDLVLEENAKLTLAIGQNRASVLAANSISGDGTIEIKTLDQLFITDAKEIDVKNILLVDNDGAELGVEILPEVLGNGWKIEIIDNGDGTHTTKLVKVSGSLEDSLVGGYRDSISEYTQSNVDMLNSMKIRDAGYGYARKAAFMKGIERTVQEEVMVTKEAPPVVTSGKEAFVVSPVISEVAIIEKIVVEEDRNVQFAEIFGQAGKYDGSTGSNYDYDTFGVTGGTFRKLDNNWTAGISYGYASSDVDYKKNGSEDVDSLGINGYLSHRMDNWLVTGSLGYSWSKHDLTRKAFDRDSLVDSSIIGDNRLTADFDSHTFNVGLEVGYNYALNENISLYPYAGLDYVWYNRDAYTESGDGNLALKVDKVDYGVPMSKLGLMYEAAYDKWNFMADLAWVHNFYDSQDKGATKANFKNLNSSAKFNILGLDLGKDTGVASLGVAYDFTDDFTVGAEYSGFVRDGEFGNKGAVNFSYKW